MKNKMKLGKDDTVEGCYGFYPNCMVERCYRRSECKWASRLKNKLQLAAESSSRKELEDYIAFYRKQGFNFIPIVYGEKRAVVPWDKYQQQKATEQEIQEWFIKPAGMINIGIVCGQISDNLVVVDFDAGTVAKGLKEAEKVFGKNIISNTFIVQTSKGVHVYLHSKWPVKTLHMQELGIDIQGEGAYVLAPPSKHPSGADYKPISLNVPVMQWEGDLIEDIFTKLPKLDKNFNADRYRQPLDVNELLKGTSEGNRDVAALQLATWYRKQEKNEVETLSLLKEWNGGNSPPMDERQLEKCVRSAYKNEKPYSYRFNQEESENFTEETERAADALLAEPEIIPFILKATRDIVEEEGNKVSMFLLNLVAESFDLSGESASGKNTVAECILDCFPRNSWVKITGMSDKSLRYLTSAPTMYFTERRAFHAPDVEESTTETDLKLLISEGKLTTKTTEKVEGKYTTVEHVTTIRNAVMTSTEVEIAEELKNRIWQLTTDYSPEHVQSVIKAKLNAQATAPTKRINTTKERRIIRCAMQKLLDKKWLPTIKDYVVPYAPELAAMLGQEPRANRDVTKLLKAIYASALLHYRNRPVIKEGNAEYIVCTPEDLWNVMTYSQEAIYGTLTGGTKTRWFEDKWKVVQEMNQKNKLINIQTFMSVSGCGKSTAYRWLERFAQEGQLTKMVERGKTWYTIAENLLGTQNKSGNLEGEKVKWNDPIDLHLAAFWKTTIQWIDSIGCSTIPLEKRKEEIKERKIKVCVLGGKVERWKERIANLPNAEPEIGTWQ